MDGRRQKPMIAWFTVALLIGVQAWVGFHKAADHHHPHHDGHHHAHARQRFASASIFQQLQAIAAQQFPADHSHDDHPPHRDEDHEIVWAPLRKSAVDVVFTGAVLPVCFDEPVLTAFNEPEPLNQCTAPPLRRPDRIHRDRGPPLFFVA